jgi:hypothetical protein
VFRTKKHCSTFRGPLKFVFFSFLKQREADLDRIELRSMKSQASIGYNIIFTTLTAFAVGWFIGRYYFGDGTTVRRHSGLPILITY